MLYPKTPKRGKDIFQPSFDDVEAYFAHIGE